MNKILISLFMTAVLTIAPTLQSFADSSVQSAARSYSIGEFTGWSMVYPANIEPLGLNVYRSTPTPANLQKVTLWEHDPYDSNAIWDQTFTVQYSRRDERPRFYSRAGYDAKNRTGYSFNMNTSNYGVMIYYDGQDDYRDAEVDLLTRDYNGNTCYHITLPHRNSRAVTVRNRSNGSQVFWDLLSTENRANQLWYNV